LTLVSTALNGDLFGTMRVSRRRRGW